VPDYKLVAIILGIRQGVDAGKVAVFEEFQRGAPPVEFINLLKQLPIIIRLLYNYYKLIKEL